MRHAGGYSYDEDYDLDKCVICGRKMPNEDEPTCSLICEEEREEREEREKRKKEKMNTNSKVNEKDKQIKEVLTFLRSHGYTTPDSLDELKLLINANSEEEKQI
ncbi:hypothetical protein U8V72_25425 [Priestia filamentosa]|uniref:hypothetical protein n=1 Tax=Priestia filamentosa TaxID=1402861 RepID=UPI00397CB926